MEPIKFEQQNTTYAADGCLDLPAHKAEDQIISCWKLTEQEIAKIKQTGTVWLSVMGRFQPPVWLGVDTPFVDNANNVEEESNEQHARSNKIN